MGSAFRFGKASAVSSLCDNCSTAILAVIATGKMPVLRMAPTAPPPRITGCHTDSLGGEGPVLRPTQWLEKGRLGCATERKQDSAETWKRTQQSCIHKPKKKRRSQLLLLSIKWMNHLFPQWSLGIYF
jgi:hypothetical protein